MMGKTPEPTAASRSGTGEMAERIAAFDWSSTPLGPLEIWPQSLKVVVQLMLDAEDIMLAPWGQEGVLLYNDAYSRLIGPRSPMALGRPVFEVLPELRPVLQLQFAEVMAGRAVKVRDQPCPFVRTTALEDAWFDVSHNPVRGENGEVAGILTILTETTGRVEAERRREVALIESEKRKAFLLKLSDALRPLSDAAEIQRAAMRVVGEFLEVDRVMYGEITPNGETGIIHDNYLSGRIPKLTGELPLAAFGSSLDSLKSGEPLIVADVDAEPDLGETEKARYKEIGSYAHINVPLIKNGRWVAGLSAQHCEPRRWMPEEIEVLQETAERTWAAVERARAEAALRDSEAKLAVELADTRQLHRISSSLIVEDDVNTLYDQILEAARSLMQSEMASIQRLVPERRQLLLLAQHGFAPESAQFWEWVRADHTTSCGVAFARGEAVIVPDVELWDFVAGTEDLMHYRRSGIRAVLSTPLVARDGRLVGVMSTHWREVHQPSERELRLLDVLARQAADLIERRAAEEALRESEERQAFSLKLSDALRSLADPAEIESAACRLVAAQLDVDRAYYVEIDEARGLARVVRDFVRGISPSLAGEHPIASFSWSVEILRRGECQVVVDTQDTPLVPAADRAACAALQIAACMGAPLIKGRRLVGALCVTAAEPRSWKTEEVEFLRAVGERIWAAIERARSEAALRQSEETFSLLVESAPFGVYLIDAQFRLCAINAGSRKVFSGIEPLIGRDFAEILRILWQEPFATEAIKRFRHTLRTGQSFVSPTIIEQRANIEQIESYDWQIHRVTMPDGSHGVVCYFYDLSQQKRVEAAARASEERLRAIIDGTYGYIGLLSPDGTLLEANRASLEFAAGGFGSQREDVVGRPFWETIWFVHTPGAPEIMREAIARAAAGEFIRYEAPLRRPSGEVVVFDVSLHPIEDERGRVVLIVPEGRIITDRVRAEEALRESEELFRQFGDASSDVLWARSAETLQWEYLSPAFESIYGLSRELALRGDTLANWTDLIEPEDREFVLANLEKVRGGERVTFEYRIRRPSDGALRWVRDADFALRDASGRVQRIGGIGHDATEEKELAERMKVLVAELQHRTRNLIAVVRAIAQQTMAATGPTEAFCVEFNHRLEALGRVQGLLSRADKEPITIESLIRMELDALGASRDAPDRVVLAGPAVRIRHSMVQTLALVLHELATNARKHGALATDLGRLRISWRVRKADGQGRRLALEWVEDGAAAPIDLDPERRGYGRELIERALPYSLGAETRYELRPEGARCFIDLPLEKSERKRRTR